MSGLKVVQSLTNRNICRILTPLCFSLVKTGIFKAKLYTCNDENLTLGDVISKYIVPVNLSKTKIKEAQSWIIILLFRSFFRLFASILSSLIALLIVVEIRSLIFKTGIIEVFSSTPNFLSFVGVVVALGIGIFEVLKMNTPTK
jgi:hypothetical protein